MRHLVAILIAVSFFGAFACSSVDAQRHWVNGYTRSDGTYVKGHWRGGGSSQSSGSSSSGVLERAHAYIALKKFEAELPYYKKKLEREEREAYVKHFRYLRDTHKERFRQKSEAARLRRAEVIVNTPIEKIESRKRYALMKKAERVQTWKSRDGKYSLKARLVYSDTHTAYLKRADGVEIQVKISKLHSADQDFLMKLGKYNSEI